MANPEHVGIVRRGAEAIRKWRQANPGVQLDLHEADLRRVDLTEMGSTWVDLSGADLSGADLSESNISGPDFDHAACLEMANLNGTRLIRANLLLTFRKRMQHVKVCAAYQVP
jgi:uncharacterized protein YjbI with pentapeptide repeats